VTLISTLWCMATHVLRGCALLCSGRTFALARSVSFRPVGISTGLSLIILPSTTWRSTTITTSFPSCVGIPLYLTTITSSDNTCDSEAINMPTGYLNASNAAALDAELMSTPGYSLEQLMELAGLAVAEAIYQAIPPILERKRKILLICGPGNNGGDGLVAARHLIFFNHYECVIVYPKRSNKEHFVNLVKQCQDVGILLLEEMPNSEEMKTYDAIADSIFGFSFKGEPREPFATIMKQMIEAQRTNDNLQVVSVDVPSGWDVDEGDVAKTGFVPDILISLTAPKMCSKKFTGRHFIGGRFLPRAVANKYNVRVGDVGKGILTFLLKCATPLLLVLLYMSYTVVDATVPSNKPSYGSDS
jgi:NAD(P)H-hydrate epimerase